MATAMHAHAGTAHADSLAELAGAWDRAPSLVTVGVLLTIPFVLTLRASDLPLRCRIGRVLAWCGAWIALVLALGSPIDAAGTQLVSAHMVQHMLLGDLAPALLAAALATGVGPPLAARIRGSRFAPLARAAARVPMVVVVAAWAITWGAWHSVRAYELALEVPAVHALEHGSLLVVGAWLWFVVLDPFAADRDRHVPARIGVAVAALFFGAILTNTLTYVDEPSYAALAGESERLLGWSSVADQQVAGLIMLGGQAVTLGAALWMLVRRHLAGTATRDVEPRAASTSGASVHPLGW